MLVAAGAVGVGVAVSSNAMAASSAPGDHALTISMISSTTNGDAFQCTFDAATVPVAAGFPPSPPDGAVVHTSLGAGTGTGTITSGSLVVSSSGALPAPPPGAGTKVVGGAFPADAAQGVIAISGAVSADGSSSVSQIAADGTVTPVKIRQGTADECAAAQKGIPPAAVISGGSDGVGTTNTPDTTVIDPNG